MFCMLLGGIRKTGTKLQNHTQHIQILLQNAFYITKNVI
jgi:hypothetical protein